jgi:hypothetical protein
MSVVMPDKDKSGIAIVAFVLLWVANNLTLGFLMMNSYIRRASDPSFAGMYLIFGPFFFGLPFAISCALLAVGVHSKLNKGAHTGKFIFIGTLTTVAIYVYFLVDFGQT